MDDHKLREKLRRIRDELLGPGGLLKELKKELEAEGSREARFDLFMVIVSLNNLKDADTSLKDLSQRITDKLEKEEKDGQVSEDETPTPSQAGVAADSSGECGQQGEG